MTVEKDFWKDVKEIIGIYKVHTALCYEGSLKFIKTNKSLVPKNKLKLLIWTFMKVTEH